MSIKLDLMTILVLFVVLSVVVTMFFSTDDSAEPAVAAPGNGIPHVSGAPEPDMAKHFYVSHKLKPNKGVKSW